MRFKQYINESSSLTTTLQESLHCIGFGIAQMKKKLTVDTLLDGGLFTTSYNNICDVDIGIDVLYQFAQKNPSWVDSVINNVNSVRQSGYIKPDGYKFYRSNGIMDLVYKKSSILLKKSGIKLNADKWNPGDIWISSLSYIPEFDNIIDYNNWLSEQLKKKTLISVSLKKSKGKPKVIYVDKSSDKKSLEYKRIKTPVNIFTTGINILTSDPSISLNIRSFSILKTSAITSEIFIKKSSARHGKSTLSPYIKKYNIPWMSLKEFRDNSDDTMGMINKIISLYKDCGFIFSKNQIDKDWSIRSNEKEYKRNPAGYFRSIINSLQFGAFMNKNKNISSDILTDIYLKGSSMSEYSSDYIKVY